MADEADMANDLSERSIALTLARMAAVSHEPAAEDEDGNRYCLDCGEIIPAERVRLVQAVRCVHCAGKRERGNKFRGR